MVKELVCVSPDGSLEIWETEEFDDPFMKAHLELGRFLSGGTSLFIVQNKNGKNALIYKNLQSPECDDREVLGEL